MASTTSDRITGLSSGVAIKAPCRVATTANITLEGLQTIDGVTLETGDRVLVKDQTDATANGIYTADTSEWKRAKDFNGPRDVAQGTLVSVYAGTTSAKRVYRVISEDISFGTSDIEFDIANETLGNTGTSPTQVPTNADLSGLGFERQVDSVSDLRSSTFPAALKRLWLAGYYGVGTPGSGPLRADRDDTTTADNGGTVLVDADGVRWKRPEGHDFKAVGAGFGIDGDNTTELLRAIEVADSEGKILKLPDGEYDIETGGTQTVSKIRGMECDEGLCVLNFPSVGNSIRLSVDENIESLASDATKGNSHITVSTPGNFAPGDIVFLIGTDTVESGFSNLTRDIAAVSYIDGSDVHLGKKLRFGYPTADVTVRRYRPPESFSIKNIRCNSGSHKDLGDYLLELVAFKNVSIENFGGDSDEGNDGATIARFFYCVNVRGRGLDFRNCGYGILAVGGHNHRYFDVSANNTRHPFAPASLLDGFYVKGLSGEGNRGIVDGHVPFDLFYEDVYTNSDVASSNMRAIGGGLKNCRIRCTDTGTAQANPRIMEVSLVDFTDAEIFGDAVFIAENVEWTHERSFQVNKCGRVELSNVKSLDLSGNELGVRVSRGGTDLVDELVLRRGTTLAEEATDSTDEVAQIWMSRGVYREFPIINAEYDAPDDVYVIDPVKTTMLRETLLGKCYGEVFQGESRGDGVNLEEAIRIHTNYQQQGGPSLSNVAGILKLRAYLFHGDTGRFSVRERWFNFFHKKTSTSSVEFPVTSIFVGDRSGQTNEDLEISIASPSQQGNTEVGSGDWRNHWVQFDLTLTTATNAPVYSLYYELELLEA